MIQDAAVETAAEWLPHSGDCEVRPERDCTCWQSRVNIMRAALEAAAPHLLSHEREETRLAHLDAVVNAETVDRLQAKLDAVEALAAAWEARGESDIEFSKDIIDENISISILTDGAQMVEHARHIRVAIGIA